MSNSGLSLNELWPLMKEVIDSGGEFAFGPRGISMMPLIRQGQDQVVIVKAENLKKGDAVLYQRDNGIFVLHRIVKVKKNGYVMCGDNQYELEYGITDKHILAKMKSVIRDGVTVDENNKKYRRYVKHLPFRRLKKRIRIFLGKTKAKIFKRKAV